jgi:UDP-glucose 4-epimerase
MRRPNRELMAQYFPQVPITREIGEHESLQSTEKARRLMGYVPQHSWRNR